MSGVAPPEDHPLLVEGIINDLHARDWQQTPGDIGHVYLIRALAQAGRSDVLHRVYSRTGVGSYGGVLAKGLTAMPETWDATRDGYQSLNHFMLGHVVEWLYEYVLGVRQAPGAIGWRRVLIAPCPGRLTEARGRVLTPHGPIHCRWHVKGEKLHATVVLPTGLEPPMEAEFVSPDNTRQRLSPGTNEVVGGL
ncbi:MAG: alpha-L-rhamnosidase C-terminal domain-containing protein [Planctomycetota bacterium]